MKTRALLTGLVCLLASGTPSSAQEVPREIQLNVKAARRVVEHRCPGCDCLDGQCFTPSCDCTLPVTQEWAEGMLASTIRVLSPILDGFDGHEVALRLRVVDPSTLGIGGGEEAQGIYDAGGIRISDHLTRRQAGAVIAHEFGHAWHDVHNALSARAQQAQVEGFAEWVAYQALRRFGDEVGAEAITSNIDPVYGGGFRFYRRIEKEDGLAEVLTIAASWIDLQGTRVPEEVERAHAIVHTRVAPRPVQASAVRAPLYAAPLAPAGTPDDDKVFR